MTVSGTRFLRAAAALTFALGLGACASVDTATRDTPPTASLIDTPDGAVAPSVQIVDIQVSVPRELRVSEANRYYPSGDIVWREDPIGDRHQQVADVVRDGLMMGAERIEGDIPVIVGVEVTRFHALTEKARYTIGGVHAIQFYMQLFDPETGAPLGEPHFVKADFDALGGQPAIQAEAKGITQRVRITQHLAKVLQDELTGEQGYHSQANGLIGALNQL